MMAGGLFDRCTLPMYCINLPSKVNGWCNNRNQPYLTDLIRTAEVLEVAPADLIVDG